MKIGDEITIVPFSGVETIRATVSAVAPHGARNAGPAALHWTTDWQVHGHVLERDEGITWARGYVDTTACDALLAAFALDGRKRRNSDRYYGANR